MNSKWFGLKDVEWEKQKVIYQELVSQQVLKEAHKKGKSDNMHQQKCDTPQDRCTV